jgi:hypothetical protein
MRALVTKMARGSQSQQNFRNHCALSSFVSQGRSVVVWSRLRPMLFFALIALGAPTLAQRSPDKSQDPANSVIRGFVIAVSPSGESTPRDGVRLKLTGGPTGKEFRSALTNADGHYRFDYLCGGTYRLEVRVKGFESFDRTVLLGRDEVRVENVVLRQDRL